MMYLSTGVKFNSLASASWKIKFCSIAETFLFLLGSECRREWNSSVFYYFHQQPASISFFFFEPNQSHYLLQHPSSAGGEAFAKNG